MRKSMFAALMAAASLIPGAAMAQREGDGRSFDRDRPRGAAVEVRETVDQPPAQRTARAEPQARADRGDGSPRGDAGQGAGRGPGGDRGDDGNRGGFDRRGPDAARPAPAPAPVAQADRGDDRRGPAGRGDGGQWRGNDAGRADSQRRGTDSGRGNAQWRGDGDRGGNVQWRGNDRGNQWRGNDRGQDFRGNQGNWNRGWRQDNRYDWNRRRQVNRSAFHLPRYYAPSGWGYGYRRFDVGITLNSGLFNRNYWIDDADYYGLPDAYGPYRWVRYYNDALLVDVYSGRVVDTVYDIFW